jgi:RNA-directed DNA polymerase
LRDELLERILRPENLEAAWKRVKANKGAAGVDGMDVEAFPAHVRANWEQVRHQLEQGSYRPSPVLRVKIPKKSGGDRLLGIPTVWANCT